MTPTVHPFALTMGDASGIGPEIIAKTFLEERYARACVVFGDPRVMQQAISDYAWALTLRRVDHPAGAHLAPGVMNIVATSHLAELPPRGQINAASGQAAFDAIVAAIACARSGSVAGIVTAPIHKEALAASGQHYPGHTEILADKGGATRVAMMLANEDLRTVLVTIHCSLAEAIRRVDFDAELAAIRLAHLGGQALGFAHPRVAVAGLNPHAGEGGLFGDEEIRILGPAIEVARQEGILASGPWPGDTVFMQARTGRFDVVVAQYHDQGLIPVKYLGLAGGVNITLGLPFVRTSPDHGTAFDIAGKGVADPASLKTAIDYALRLAEHRQVAPRVP